LYELLGAKDKLDGRYFDFDHGYNAPMRKMLYEFVNEHLRLGHETPIEERDYVPLKRDELTVWTSEHPKPACDEDAEVAVVRWFADDAKRQVESLVPKDRGSLARYREVVGGALEILIGRGLPTGAALLFEESARSTSGDILRIAGYLRSPSEGEARPMLVHYPSAWHGGFALWLDEHGKAGLYRDGELRPGARALVEKGFALIGIDLFQQGEYL